MQPLSYDNIALTHQLNIELKLYAHRRKNMLDSRYPRENFSLSTRLVFSLWSSGSCGDLRMNRRMGFLLRCGLVGKDEPEWFR
jgi:hypothetical protein